MVFSSLPLTKFERLKGKLHHHRKRARVAFVARHQKAATWLAEKQLMLPGVQASTKLLTSASLFGTLLLAAPQFQPKILPPTNVEEKLEAGVISASEVNSLLENKMTPLLADQSIGFLDSAVQTRICAAIKEVLDVKSCFTLDGIRLNHAYGWMGYEQHLQRFPGDTLDQHDEELVAGIAPGLGGWGYFANSRAAMTPEIVLREKYYVAVQTLYMPEWNTRTKELVDWFRFRKVLVINPENGKAVVGVVGDAGPADWTGKQFGGSPELMKELDLHLGPRKGEVLLLFLDDQENKVPLGPLDYNLGKGKLEEA